MNRTVLLLVVPLAFATAGGTEEKPQESPIALERKLVGEWKGTAACQGDLVLNADHSLELRNHSPGNYRLKGKWAVRWDALPPTLVMSWTTTTEPDHRSEGKTWEVKLVQLNDKVLMYESPGPYRMLSERVKK
jgi:hypothetical protein